MTYTLFVSHDAGMSYYPAESADSIEELKPHMERYNDNWLRWYVEEDGKHSNDYICNIHFRLIATILNARQERQP